MTVHPEIINEFIKNNSSESIHIKYARTKKFQYLVMNGSLSAPLKSMVKLIFPGSILANGNTKNRFYFKLNPEG